jgi:hypothetical protein
MAFYRLGDYSMEENEFFSKMDQADQFLQKGGNSSYYAGYVRGLRRRYRGVNSKTQEDHDKWMMYINDEAHMAMGHGYQDGFMGKTPKWGRRVAI